MHVNGGFWNDIPLKVLEGFKEKPHHTGDHSKALKHGSI